MIEPVFKLLTFEVEDEDNGLALPLVDEESIVYSKLTDVAEAGKFDSSVKQQHFTKSRPFSLPPQL